MVSKPDFLSGSGQDHFRPELQVESPEGELHLRFYIPSHQEFALQATGIREVIELSPDRITPIPNASPLLLVLIESPRFLMLLLYFWVL